MTNYSFLKKYQELQNGVIYDQVIDLGFAKIVFSKKDKTTFYNFALVDTVLSDEQLSEIYQNLQVLGRTPAVYFEDRDDSKLLASLLLQKDYHIDYCDSWMFYQGQEIDQVRFNQVRKVRDGGDLQLFLNTFDRCYKKGDPQNAYGTLGDYLMVAKQVWDAHHLTDRVEYFIAFEDDKPVAVATLTSRDGLGYISNVGSLSEVRGKGFGKLVALYCVSTSMKKGNVDHCLATEEGTYPNEFYKRIGFKTLFTGVCYAK